MPVAVASRCILPGRVMQLRCNFEILKKEMKVFAPAAFSSFAVGQKLLNENRTLDNYNFDYLERN